MKERIEKARFPVFSRRALVLGGAKAALLGVLAGRLYYLQVVDADQYRMLADENRMNLRLLAPPRGRILDRRGAALATNRQNFRVLIVPEQAPSVEDTLDVLSGIVHLDEHDRARVLKEAARKRSFVPISVVDNLTWSEFAKISVRTPDLPGIQLDVGDTRDYPFGAHTAHTVGYVAPVSEKDLQDGDGDPLLELPGFRIGKRGLERSQETVLRGRAGNQRVEVNAFGRVIRELSRTEGRPGDDVTVTLDARLQRFSMQRLAEAGSGAAVVMDVHTGDVLAMASTPTFDPNAFNVGLSSAEWRRLTQNVRKPLTNKAISGRYPPGSTFKMLVALAAMETGAVGPGHRVFCNGRHKLGNHTFHCWKRWGHGWMDMTDAITESCDVYFYEIARTVGIDRIAAMAERFGLGQTQLPEIPGERAGVVPTKLWKEGAIGEPWQLGETLIAGIGQGYLLTTPLQLATMTARLANGEQAVSPRLLFRGDPSAAPPLGVAEGALDVVRRGMFDVVNGKRGTARAAKLEDERWQMAGKTGTAQVRRISKAERESGVIKNEDLEWRSRDHALFVCYAPFDAPRYAISVLIEHGGSGSATAAPVARDIMQETLDLDPSRARVAEKKPEQEDG
ncbi:MAG: penicillin-binding protein 2 [Minwuia sp.]|uniref:penicillin-binding protein 2 n=1 Tax=Minwuia sp. TaxID=2493630 RepID=UPI003A8BF69C